MSKLSKRLEMVASFIDENDKSVIDIGCDHGLLSIYLAEKFNNLKIIASDVNNNALESARRNVSKYKLEDRIDIRLGSGVSVINDELLKTSTIRRLNNVHFNGYLDRLIDDTYELSGTLSGTMILPDDITLEDYEYNFTSSIDEKIDETRINFQKTIDITEDLWQNILVEIPLKCVNDKNKDLTLEGDGWRLISEDDVKLENNPLSSLKDLL